MIGHHSLTGSTLQFQYSILISGVQIPVLPLGCLTQFISRYIRLLYDFLIAASATISTVIIKLKFN